MYIYCECIINLHTRYATYPRDYVSNEKDYITNNIHKQDTNAIYLYVFSNGNKYYAVSGDDVIEPINDPCTSYILWKICSPKKTKGELINSIIKNTIYIHY